MSFPTTNILTDFTFADGALATQDNRWTGDPYAWGAAGWEIASNRISKAAVPNQCLAGWNPSTFGPDCEVFCTVVEKSTTTNDFIMLYARMGEFGASANQDGYALRVITNSAGTDTWGIYSITDGNPNQLGVLANQELTNGDKIGLECIGDAISAYIYTGGSWTQVLTRTDTTYSGAGRLAIECWTNVANLPKIDDFGGGTVVTGPTLDSCLPDADIVTTGWSTTPLFSKVNDNSDATVIQATAV